MPLKMFPGSIKHTFSLRLALLPIRIERETEMNSRYRYDATVAGPRLNPELEARIRSATTTLQQARERLDIEPIASLFAEDAVYEAQNVLEPLVGKQRIIDYLEERFAFLRRIRNDRDIGRLLSATIDLPQAADHPCLVFVAEGRCQALWVVSVNDDGRVARIDILTAAPRPDEARLERGTDKAVT